MHRAFAHQHQLQARAAGAQRAGGGEQFAQALLGHQPAHVGDHFGLRGQVQGLARFGAVGRMEDGRVAAVGDGADAVRVGAVVAFGDPAQILADHQQAAGGMQHRAGQAAADGVAHAQIRTARPDHQRHAEPARGQHRAVGVRVQPVRQHQVRGEGAHRRGDGARAQAAVERAADGGQGGVAHVFDVAAGHVVVFVRGPVQVAARLRPARIGGDRAEHADLRQPRKLAHGLVDRAAAVGLAGNRELRSDDQQPHVAPPRQGAGNWPVAGLASVISTMQ